MAAVTFDGSDLNRLSADLGKVGPSVLRRIRSVVQKVCADTKRDAQLFCPVDTGYLRGSITYDTRYTASGVVGEVGPTASYGEFVEFGTSRMAPAAYMGPSFDRNAGLFQRAVETLTEGLL